MIRLSQITLRRGAKTLLEGADASLNPGDRIGLIGANGSGKSSLFALLRGELHADQGEVDYPARWRVAYVAQETPALERAALDYAIDGDTTLRRLERELVAAEAADDGHLLGELHAAMGDANAYTVRSRAEQLLHGLGFSHQQMGEPVASFSGGWRMRLNLAQALMCPSDLLLLDEPTNHLDLDAILWLEEWLKRYPGTLLIVSHDRDFLDGVVEVVVHIDAKKLRRYSGNYSGFERQRAEGVVLAASQYAKQHEDAGEDGRARSPARLRALLFRVPRSAQGARPAAGAGGRGRRLQGGRHAGQDRRARHQLLAAERRALRAPRHQRRGEIHADQDHRRRASAARRQGDLQQGAGGGLLRAAPDRDAAPRRISSLAPLAHHDERAR